MGALFSYSLYSSILLSLLYLTYKWVLAGENQHSFNRVALWGIYAVSLLALPVGGWIGGLVSSGSAVGAEIELGEMMMALADDGSADLPVGQPLYLTLLLWLYAVGMVLALMQTLWIAMKLSRIISRGERLEEGGYRVIITGDEGIAPFSWCRYVVMSRRDWDESGRMILTHELQHLRLRHWIDLVVAQVIGILQWYNPAAWLMREELKTVHEYQADRVVINSGVGVRDYQMLLIKKAVGARFPSLANSLNHSKLKKRITMMYNQNNQGGRRLRAMALVPALGIAVAVTNLDAVASVLSDTASAVIVDSADAPETQTENPSTRHESPVLEEMVVIAYKNTEKSSDGQMPAPASAVEASAPSSAEQSAAVSANKEDVFTVVEKKPEFPGGDAELMKYIAEHIRYPEAARKAEVEGRVIAQFVVRKDGKIGEVKILRGVSPELDGEAVRVIRSLPAFAPGEMHGKPVAVWYTIPITFKLKGDNKAAGTDAASSAQASGHPRAVSADAPSAGGENMVFTVVEKRPEFPGGEAELMKYLMENIKYPEASYKNKEQGRVVVQFVVKKDGAIGDVKVLRSINEALDSEAVRVVRSLPAFTPGEIKGKPVAVWYTLPIIFKIKEDKKDEETKPAEATAGLFKLSADSVKYFLDGKRYYGSLDKIDPNQIQSVTVDKHSERTPRILIYTKPAEVSSEKV